MITTSIGLLTLALLVWLCSISSLRIVRQPKMGVNGHAVCAAFVFAYLEGDDGMHYECFINGVCMCGIAIVEEMWMPTGINWTCCEAML